MIDIDVVEACDQYNEQVLTLADGATLHIWRRTQDSASAHIVVVHGFGEHSGRYRELAGFLFQRGFDITGFDQRGHGKSSGLPGHVDRFSDYEHDLSRVIEAVIARRPKKLFLVAHSMGGLVTLRYLAGQPPGIAGAVVSAPMVGFAVRVPKLKMIIGRASAFCAPRLRMPNEIDPSVLSRDPEVGRVYAADPLVHRVVSGRWFSEATRAMDEMTRAAPLIAVPVLIMHGTDDKLASIDATRRVFGLIGSSDKQLILYPGFYHELFNEPERPQIFDTVGDWLSLRCAGL